jgi:hypothetical protein
MNSLTPLPVLFTQVRHGAIGQHGVGGGGILRNGAVVAAKRSAPPGEARMHGLLEALRWAGQLSGGLAGPRPGPGWLAVMCPHRVRD